jgi:glucosamine 6-phosphate synthetase-like amidotransferase/phosphosugar isomerase protein
VDQAEKLERSLRAAADLARRTLEGVRDVAEEAASLLTGASLTIFLGAGPSRATAEFGAAKLFEGPQRHAVAQHLEEWAHEQYFVSGPRTPVVITAPTGASRDRAAELIAEMAFIGVPSLLVSDAVDDELSARASRRLRIAAGLDETLSPLLTCLPIAFLAGFLAKQLGSRSYGFQSAEHEKEHYATIHRSTIGEPA